jgi:type I restriction enzyme S subunit
MSSNNKKPKLRFPQFSNSWEAKRIDEVTEKVSIPVKVNKSELYQQIGIRSHGKGLFHKELVTGEALGNKRVFWVQDNLFVVNIVFAWEQAVAKTTRAEIGMIASHRFPMFKPLDGILDLDFLLTLFLTKKGKALLELASPGGAGRNKTLGQSEFAKTKINLPTFSEQQKIATFLTAVDEKIQQLTKKKDLLEQYKKGVTQKIFNQEIRFKDDNGNDFADWEEKKLGDVITNKSEKYNPEKEKVNYKCIELEHLASETPALLGYVDSNNSGSIKNKFQKGDVLFGKLRPYLKKYLQAPFDGVCSSEIWVLKGKGILNAFLFRLIQTDEFISLANQSTGSKMPRADWNVISASLFAIPSRPEQKKIADFLSAIDDKINLVNQQLEKTQTFKKGLLQQMFI